MVRFPFQVSLTMLQYFKSCYSQIHWLLAANLHSELLV